MASDLRIESITPERLLDLYIATSAAVPHIPLPMAFLPSSRPCSLDHCGNEAGPYHVEGFGFVCRFCANLRLIRGLLEMIRELRASAIGSHDDVPTISVVERTSGDENKDEYEELTPPEFTPRRIDPILPNEGSDRWAKGQAEANFHATAKSFDGNSANTVHIGKGSKVNVMDLPPGTVLTFDKPKARGFDIIRDPGPNGEDRSEPRTINDRNDPEGLGGSTLVRKYSGLPMHLDNRPAFDYSTMEPGIRSIFEPTQPLSTRSFQSAGDVYAYEREQGESSIMEALEDIENEDMEEYRNPIVDAIMAKNAARQADRSEGGARTLRTSRPSSEAEQAPEFEGAFPSIARMPR